jgi:hypothetical protein
LTTEPQTEQRLTLMDALDQLVIRVRTLVPNATTVHLERFPQHRLPLANDRSGMDTVPASRGHFLTGITTNTGSKLTVANPDLLQRVCRVVNPLIVDMAWDDEVLPVDEHGQIVYRIDPEPGHEQLWRNASREASDLFENVRDQVTWILDQLATSSMASPGRGQADDQDDRLRALLEAADGTLSTIAVATRELATMQHALAQTPDPFDK